MDHARHCGKASWNYPDEEQNGTRPPRNSFLNFSSRGICGRLPTIKFHRRRAQRHFPRRRDLVKTIVVDDEPVIADTLVNILEGEGHDALAVSHGESAVKWAKMVLPDAVISDV